MHQDHIVVVRAENLFRLTLVKHFELFHSLFYFYLLYALFLYILSLVHLKIHYQQPNYYLLTVFHIQVVIVF